jgi:ADP-ribose pyrophosphatase YjhB (NUDIX family)
VFCGILLLDERSGRILLLRRSELVGDPGLWSVPGGGTQWLESAVEAASRELVEEAGPPPLYDVVAECETHGGAVIFLAICSPGRWKPDLNDENDAAGWFSLWDLPEPLHPGVVSALGQFGFL